MTQKKAAVPETLTVDLDRAVLALSDAVEFVGVDDIGHGHRVALMAAMCARAMDWEPERIHQLVQTGLMHDCGVSATREHRMLVDEIAWEGAHAHCERGFAFLSSVPALAHLAPAVLQHHTPWSQLVRGGGDHRVAEDANLIFLCDRADALRARGVAEGRQLIDVLARYEGNYFSRELMAGFREEASREAFWFAQEEPTLRERVGELAISGAAKAMSMADIKALAGMFGRIIDAKSPYTERHSLGVANVALRLGRHFGLPATELDKLEVAALLHDLGKLRIPDDLLEKQGPLTAEERRRMARHAFDTYEVLRRVFGPGSIADWAAFHHEYVSGHGYPFHREAAELPLEARIVAVADVLQALAQRRPYRQPLKPEEIVAILDGMVFGGKLAREVVDVVKENLEACWQDAVAQEATEPSS